MDRYLLSRVFNYFFAIVLGFAVVALTRVTDDLEDAEIRLQARDDASLRTEAALVAAGFLADRGVVSDFKARRAPSIRLCVTMATTANAKPQDQKIFESDRCSNAYEVVFEIAYSDTDPDHAILQWPRVTPM